MGDGEACGVMSPPRTNHDVIHENNLTVMRIKINIPICRQSLSSRHRDLANLR